MIEIIHALFTNFVIKTVLVAFAAKRGGVAKATHPTGKVGQERSKKGHEDTEMKDNNSSLVRF